MAVDRCSCLTAFLNWSVKIDLPVICSLTIIMSSFTKDVG